MEQDTLRRLLLESVVDRGLRSMRSDPERSLRKLVDLGRDLAAGPGQKQFLSQVQKVLSQRDCPYYRLARDLAVTVDDARLKTCGINLGWNCLTVGARQIRAREKQLGRHIPWSLTFRLSGDPAGTEAARRTLREGLELGIRTYFLFPQDRPAAVEQALSLSAGAPECAVFLFLPPAFPVEGLSGARQDHLILGLDTSAPGWEKTADRLRQAGYLYLYYRLYRTPEEGEEIRTGRWAHQVMSHGGFAAVAIAGADCPPWVEKQVYRYVQHARLKPRDPVLLADYYRDNLYADSCVSPGACVLSLGPESGDVPLLQRLPPLPAL